MTGPAAGRKMEGTKKNLFVVSGAFAAWRARGARRASCRLDSFELRPTGRAAAAAEDIGSRRERVTEKKIDDGPQKERAGPFATPHPPRASALLTLQRGGCERELGQGRNRERGWVTMGAKVFLMGFWEHVFSSGHAGARLRLSARREREGQAGGSGGVVLDDGAPKDWCERGGRPRAGA